MDQNTVTYETDEEYVAKITLNRPEHRNTFSTQMAIELHEALLKADKDPRARVLLLKGAGRAFCAGIDVNELGDKSALEYREWVEIMERPLVTMSKMKKPAITQVNGFAVANGMGLVAASDLAIAAENAKMGLTAINVGLNCVGPVIPVARCVGRKKALELLLYGELLSASQALSLGLINKTAPADQLEAEALKWARGTGPKKPHSGSNRQNRFLHHRRPAI